MESYLSLPVLVLAEENIIVGVSDVEKAITMLFLGKVELESVVEDAYVSSPSVDYPVPSVVRWVRPVYVPQIKFFPLTRHNIKRRDKGKCAYCGRNGQTIDHVMPRARGGRDTWENLITACFKCNNKKGCRTPEEARMPLLYEPRKPDILDLMLGGSRIRRDAWNQYIATT